MRAGFKTQDGALECQTGNLLEGSDARMSRNNYQEMQNQPLTDTHVYLTYILSPIRVRWEHHNEYSKLWEAERMMV